MGFGKCDIIKKMGFLVKVPDCTRETIFPIIARNVRPGSIIPSDCARIYNALYELGYEHYIANHSRNFVDPHTRATTNHVESM
ncbi:hypothetical protein H311_01492 [Anncaliia algerae PRA109]|nr:hypothetical protein H311_01492 [Anncaliia algerae PRA109]